MNEIENWASEKKGISFITSWENNEIIEKGLFFYHIPKTGGISFFQALSKSMTLASNGGILNIDKFQKMPQGLIDRLDEPFYAAPDNFKSTFKNTPYYLFATHQPFGFHKKSKYDFLLTTILREPFARIKSQYTYNCIRAKKGIDIEEFKRFFKKDRNINTATKQLSGLKYGREKMLEVAIENLDKYFHSFCTLKSMNQLTELYLTMFGLPSVLSDKLNSSEAIKKDAECLDNFRDEILSLNQEDIKLYEYVKANERIPKVAKEKEHSHVAIIHEVYNTKKTQGEFLMGEVKNLINLINENNPKNLGDFFIN